MSVGVNSMSDEEEDEAFVLHHQMRLAMQNLQLAARSKGIELGPVSAQQVLKMAERGELDSVAPAVEAVRAILNGRNALLLYAKKDGRICPLPQIWNELFDLLPNRRRVGNGWEPPLPLILAAWDHSSDLEKRERFLLHIQWAADHGALDQANQFIRAIPPPGWYRSNQ